MFEAGAVVHDLSVNEGEGRPSKGTAAKHGGRDTELLALSEPFHRNGSGGGR